MQVGGCFSGCFSRRSMGLGAIPCYQPRISSPSNCAERFTDRPCAPSPIRSSNSPFADHLGLQPSLVQALPAHEIDAANSGLSIDTKMMGWLVLCAMFQSGGNIKVGLLLYCVTRPCYRQVKTETNHAPFFRGTGEKAVRLPRP